MTTLHDNATTRAFDRTFRVNGRSVPEPAPMAEPKVGPVFGWIFGIVAAGLAIAATLAPFVG